MYKIYTKNVCTPPGYIKKFLLIMKITAIFLFAALMQVSAAGLAQRLTLVKKDATLKQIFDAVNKQTNYNFVWSADQLNINQPVNADFKDTPLLEVLDKCLSNTGMTYTIEDKTVVIKKKEENLSDKAKAFFAQVTVTGKVVDETGQPLLGATVKIKDTQQSTATDQSGSFTIAVPDSKTVLVFSFIGFESIELRAGDIPNGSVVTLKATATNLKEVSVNFGYYRTSKELSTGSSSRVTAADIEKQPVSDPIMALEGRVSGLSISQASGMPGAAYNIQLRGQNSIASGNNPLYIVDGVPFTANSLSSPYVSNVTNALGKPGAPGTSTYLSSQGLGLSPFNSLNPADIENIEVLKDADATAIYGSRGANGVILITTKKGKAGQTKVDVNAYSGEGKVARMMPMMNTQQYLAMRHEAFKNDGAIPQSSDYDINGTWDTTRYTNLEKYFIGGTAHFTNAQASISGGNTNTQFLIGGGYSKQTTVFPGDFSDQKASAHVNITHNSNNQKFHAIFSAQYVYDDNVLPTVDFTQFTTLAPDAPALYNPDGSLNWQNNTWQNPLSYVLYQSASTKSNNLIGNLNLSYQILPGLNLQSNFGYTHMQVNQTNQSQAGFVSGPPVATNRRNNFAENNINTWIIEPQLNYVKTIGKSKFDLLLGATVQQNVQNSNGIYAANFPTDAQISNPAAAGIFAITGNNYVQYRYNALYARINYNLKDEFLINATGRRDGSSRFGPGKQFGNFGAVGAAWIFTKEKFIENNLSFLSFGKLRGSYGVTGNDQIQDYQYLSSYSSGGTYQNIAGLSPTRIANPYFAWERVNKLEGGLELGFLKDRINLGVDYYRNRTGNQLVGYPLPSIDGFTTVQYNLPAIVQNTGLEIDLSSTNIQSKDFRWTSSFNISIPRNKLVSYPGLAGSAYSQTYAIGQPLYVQYLLHATGVNPQTGVYTFEDHNQDGKVDLNDRYFNTAIEKKYLGGFQNTFSYKQWSLDVFFQFVKQTGRNFLYSFNPPGVMTNLPTYLLDHWTKPGDQSIYPMVTQNFASNASAQWNNGVRSDAFILDASFIRLKNVSLSYTLPTGWQKSAHLSNARIYIQSQNLLTITSYKGLDPETQGLSLPPLRMIVAGFQVSL